MLRGTFDSIVPSRFVLITTALFISSCLWPSPLRVGAAEIDYVNDVLPIFETYCTGCHAEGDAQGGLVMDQFGLLMDGGESGLAITPGVASSSRLHLMASGRMEPVMPPDDMDGPTEDELKIIADWIDAGAAGPDGDMPIRRTLKVPEIEKQVKDSPITAIALSPKDGRRAQATFGRIEIFNRQDKRVGDITGEFGKVNSMTFSKDGTRVLVASGMTGVYGQAIVFDVASGEMVREYVGHADVLYAATWSPDETRIATAGYDRDIILWDSESGEQTAIMTGHNGAIFDLAFSPDGRHLVSACADETAKVWDVASAQRLDTLSQPEGEVYSVDFTVDGKFIMAVSADQRLRVWRFLSRDEPRINPLIASRVADDTPLTHLQRSDDGKFVLVAGLSGRTKLIRTKDWRPVAEIQSVDAAISDLAIDSKNDSVWISMLNGKLIRREMPKLKQDEEVEHESLESVFLEMGKPTVLSESEVTFVDGIADVPRNVTVNGHIDQPGQTDRFRFHADQGEAWTIEVDRGEGSKIDPIVAVLNQQGNVVPRTRLQAVRDTYFTFRGKNSSQVTDFRIFNWQEIGLDNYLYANGEVSKTWMPPRGADSGFNMYPGSDKRWTYFGTSPVTHALGEPAYIVRELQPGENPEPNGLPVFDIGYENDDDPMVMEGNQPRLNFVAPRDGDFTVRVGDTRSMADPSFSYQLRIRPTNPSFTAGVKDFNPKLLSGTGREMTLLIRRMDGFDGPVTFELDELQGGLHSNFPVTVEAGQNEAHGLIFAPPGLAEIEPQTLTIFATANILGRKIQRRLKVEKTPRILNPAPIQISLLPVDREVGPMEDWTLTINRGETARARILLQRTKGHDEEILFGKEDSGRNAAHGVYVDNIGLSGLVVRKGENEREMFVTADVVAQPGRRRLHVRAKTFGGLTSYPITVEVK